MNDLVDSEGSARAWLMDQGTEAEGRVYFAVPRQDVPVLPFLVVYRVGGRPDSMRSEHAELRIEAWGENKFKASQLASEVASRLVELEFSRHPEVTVVGQRVKVLGGAVNSLMPLGGTDRASRYLLDVTMHFRLA